MLLTSWIRTTSDEEKKQPVTTSAAYGSLPVPSLRAGPQCRASDLRAAAAPTGSSCTASDRAGLRHSPSPILYPSCPLVSFVLKSPSPTPPQSQVLRARRLSSEAASCRHRISLRHEAQGQASSVVGSFPTIAHPGRRSWCSPQDPMGRQDNLRSQIDSPPIRSSSFRETNASAAPSPGAIEPDLNDGSLG